MTERFAIPGVGGIIEYKEEGQVHVLLQERIKPHAPKENGLLEIPAGKLREFESVYDGLRREVREETGLLVVEIQGENEARMHIAHDYKVLQYQPFSTSLNLNEDYPIMVQVFICRVDGKETAVNDEARGHRWVTLDELRELCDSADRIYPMHVSTLRQYLELKT